VIVVGKPEVIWTRLERIRRCDVRGYGETGWCIQIKVGPVLWWFFEIGIVHGGTNVCGVSADSAGDNSKLLSKALKDSDQTKNLSWPSWLWVLRWDAMGMRPRFMAEKRGIPSSLRASNKRQVHVAACIWCGGNIKLCYAPKSVGLEWQLAQFNWQGCVKNYQVVLVCSQAFGFLLV